jgi:beta-lactamase regulating signal transducer with metallopeptidase domain
MLMTPAYVTVGWVVIHSLWLGAIIAGVTALALGLLRRAGASARGHVAAVGLALMVVTPIAAALVGADPMTPAMRMPMTRAIGEAIDLSTILWWRSIIVRTAAGVWVAGVVLSGVRIAFEWRRAQALRREALSDSGAGVRAEVANLRAQLAVRPPVDVRGSARAGVPMVLGSRRPIILLPLAAVRALGADELRAVLAHELAHVRRRDYLANLWQMAADTLLFHHPAARWVSRRIRTEREYCCDDVAIAAGGNAGAYARALATLDDARGGECRLAVAAASGTLLDRIQRIVGEPRPTLTPVRGLAVLLLMAVVAAALLTCATIIPPLVPLDAQLRQRSPAPPGAMVAPRSPNGSLPRKR